MIDPMHVSPVPTLRVRFSIIVFSYQNVMDNTILLDHTRSVSYFVLSTTAGFYNFFAFVLERL